MLVFAGFCILSVSNTFAMRGATDFQEGHWCAVDQAYQYSSLSAVGNGLSTHRTGWGYQRTQIRVDTERAKRERGYYGGERWSVLNGNPLHLRRYSCFDMLRHDYKRRSNDGVAQESTSISTWGWKCFVGAAAIGAVIAYRCGLVNLKK